MYLNKEIITEKIECYIHFVKSHGMVRDLGRIPMVIDKIIDIICGYDFNIKDIQYLDYSKEYTLHVLTFPKCMIDNLPSLKEDNLHPFVLSRYTEKERMENLIIRLSASWINTANKEIKGKDTWFIHMPLAVIQATPHNKIGMYVKAE